MHVLCLNKSRLEVFFEAYLEPSRTSMMERFCKNSDQRLLIVLLIINNL